MLTCLNISIIVIYFRRAGCTEIDRKDIRLGCNLVNLVKSVIIVGSNCCSLQLRLNKIKQNDTTRTEKCNQQKSILYKHI